MLRSEIIAQARNLLNETATGFWSDDDIYLNAWEGEKSLIFQLPDEFIKGLLKTETALVVATTPDFMDCIVYTLPTDFLKIKRVRRMGITRRVHRYVEYDNLDIYEDQSKMTYFQPGVGSSGTYIYSWHPLGLLVSPSPSLEGIELEYYKLPDKWDAGNLTTAPLIDLATHDILVDHIVYKCLMDDGEFSSADRFEKRIKERIVFFNDLKVGKK